jgi:salicylate hydroxylase
LTLALAALDAGFDVLVLEQAHTLGEVGAGVQISPNGARVLYALGLAEPLDAVAFRPQTGEMRHWHSGEVLLTRPLGAEVEARFGFPYLHLHRADLHSVLVRALAQRSPEAVRLNARVAGFAPRGSGVRVTTDNGEDFDGDVLVGADGTHSRVREQLFGDDEIRFTGCTAWRALVPVDALPANHVRPVASNWLGPGGHFVHYYVRRGELVNCVGIYEGQAWLAESWSAPGQTGAFQQDYADWHQDLRTLVGAATECYRWGLFDREPMDRWTDGPVTLLGDACHAMLPFQAQGAVMAIEDAYTLAHCLAANTSAHRALARYETLRRERTAAVQRMSRGNMSFFHNPDVPDLDARLAGHRAAHLRLYGFDATTQGFAFDGPDPPPIPVFSS